MRTEKVEVKASELSVKKRKREFAGSAFSFSLSRVLGEKEKKRAVGSERFK